jgi:hypothetical protein
LEEKRLKQRARGYTVVNGELYKSGVTEPWLRCITSEKGRELLKEIHSGFCGGTHRHQGFGRKGNKAGILLAHHKHWCQDVSSAMWSMPENGKSTESAFNASSSNSTNLASAKVGNGSSRPAANSSRQLPIRSCGSRLFHEVGGGKTTREYHSSNSLEILLAEHSLQVRSS